jgi:hypothetical protein
MRPDAVGSYEDATGIEHQVVVRETRGGWQVLDVDIAGGGARVIDTLASPDDGGPQAEAIARDYLTTVERSGSPAGRNPAGAISELGGPDARSHRSPSVGPRQQPARRVALPDPAR